MEEAAADDAEVGDNVEYWRDQSGNSNLTTRVFPGGNHSVAVRQQDGSFRPPAEFFETILNWVLDQTNG